MIGRKKELSFLTTGLGETGSLRSTLIHGEEGMGKSILVEEVVKNLIPTSPRHLFIILNGSEVRDFNSLFSSLGRNLLLGEEIPANNLREFARKLGEKIVELEGLARTGLDPEKFRVQLAEDYVKIFEDSLKGTSFGKNQLTPILIVEDLDLMPTGPKKWLSNHFNKAIRKSSYFKNSRFVFTSKRSPKEHDEFFSDFGVSSLQVIPLRSLNRQEGTALAKSHGFEEADYLAVHKETRGIPSKILNLCKKSSSLIISPKGMTMSKTSNDTQKIGGSFSEKELSYLLFASYPTVVNRYNLEFFCSPKEAAFCFNWLKRRSDLVKVSGNGNLFLNQDLRQEMRSFHKQEEPEQAERMEILASVLDIFVEMFPDPNTHWIPLNLQIFNSFTKDLCKRVFSEIESMDIIAFINEHKDKFEISEGNLRLKKDILLVIRRFIEVSGTPIKEELKSKILEQWHLDHEKASDKRVKMEQEQQNFHSEINDIEGQINDLAGLKENLVKDSKDPKRLKPKKVYSFTTSFLLIVLGLGTVGISLFSDSFGVYHSACGLALSLFGFFWPIVEIKKPKVESSGAKPNLAIETQHRSLDHRIRGLANRATSINHMLKQIEEDLNVIDRGLDEPYLLID